MAESAPVDTPFSLVADGDLCMIYRSLETQELRDRKRKLLDQMTSLSSQTIGSKSFTRDLNHSKQHLAAITFVLNERGAPYESVIVTDFSGVSRGGRAGQIENL